MNSKIVNSGDNLFKSNESDSKTLGKKSLNPGNLGENTSPNSTHPRLKNWQKNIILTILMFIAPALFFGIIELCLNIGGYGYPTNYLIPWEVNGQKVYVNNREFGKRFFPPRLETYPHPTVVPIAKDKNTLRIVVLGASAVAGEPPDMALSFSRILNAMLQEYYPEINVELINTGMTAINSHVVLPIAHDCTTLDPDLFIVYLGNNEVVGPYGAGTVFNDFSGNLQLIRAGLAIKKTRTGQFIDSIFQNLANKSTPKTWTGMQMVVDYQVPHDDPRLESVYLNFQQNLMDIARVAANDDIPILFCTPGVNQGDFAPFDSQLSSSLTKEQQNSWQKHFDEGAAFHDNDQLNEAVKSFKQAEAIDNGFAELQFRLAECAQQQARYEDAKIYYTQARDLDTLRFRADSRINEIIRTLSTQSPDDNIVLVDTDNALSNASPNRIPGSNFFYDQVHFNFEGNYVIAKTLFTQIQQTLSTSLGQGHSDQRDPLSIEECKKRLALTQWDLAQHLDILYSGMSRPPYTNQFNHNDRMTELYKIREALKSEMNQSGFSSTANMYLESIKNNPNDAFIRLKLGLLLMKLGDPVSAELEFSRVYRLWPHELRSQLLLGDALSMQNNFAKSEALYREILVDYPDSENVHSALAVVLDKQGKTPEAIKELRTAIALNPYRAELHYHLGSTLSSQVNPNGAMEEYRTTIKLNPTHTKAHLMLGMLLVKNGRSAEAIPGIRNFLELRPSNGEAHNVLGMALWRTNQIEEAHIELQRAVEIDPENPHSKAALDAFQKSIE